VVTPFLNDPWSYSGASPREAILSRCAADLREMLPHNGSIVGVREREQRANLGDKATNEAPPGSLTLLSENGAGRP
jgi:hypothetical protein